MNILIVDDQPNVLNFLTTSINWETVRIEKIFSASSVLIAKDIIRKNPVDILLTDIEMPIENGLDLIKWIRTEDYPIESILLTSHSDFIYAKQAIPLGVVDYVIQPASDEEILAAVERAVRVIEAKKVHSQNDKMRNFTLHEENQAVRHFFLNWPKEAELMTTRAQTYEKRLELFEDLCISCHEDDMYCLFMLRITEWNCIPEAEIHLLEPYKKCTERIFSYMKGNSVSYVTADYRFITFVVAKSMERIEEYLEILNNEVRETLNCSCVIYYLQTDLNKLGDALEYLQQNDSLKETDEEKVVRLQLLPKGAEVSANFQRYYDQIYQFICENITKQISRKDIADHIHISSDYISHIVRSVKNCSCNELIKIRKMEYAQTLIRTTSMPIGNIAVECGFDSFAYFTRVYKSIYGLSPSRDRSTHYKG